MSASSQIKGSECHRFFRGACRDANGAHSSLWRIECLRATLLCAAGEASDIISRFWAISRGCEAENFRLGRRRGLWLVAPFRRLGHEVVGTEKAMNER